MVCAVMKTLLSDRFAPITSSIGFLRLDLDAVAEALTQWRRKLVSGGVNCEELRDGFPDCLHALEPLTGGVRPRELVVEASDGWTAYFDCSLRGTDAVSTIGYLSRDPARTVRVRIAEPSRNGRTGVSRAW